MAEHLLSPKSAQDFANSPEDFIKLKLSSKLERKLSTKTTAQTSSRTPPREDENQITSKRLYTTAQTSRVLSREDEGQKTSRRSRHSNHGHGLNLQSQIGVCTVYMILRKFMVLISEQTAGSESIISSTSIPYQPLRVFKDDSQFPSKTPF